MDATSVESAVKAKGFAWFENGDFNLNIVGFRSPGNTVTNLFDDKLTVTYKENGVVKFHEWTITTDPGKYFMQVKLGNPKGTAKLKSGQYRGVYQIGMHNGKYEALVQTGGKVTAWRDGDKDAIYDEEKTETGYFGINIHKAGKSSSKVDNWSAGCQVFKNEADFNEFMEIVRKARKLWGNKFTYTLIDLDEK